MLSPSWVSFSILAGSAAEHFVFSLMWWDSTGFGTLITLERDWTITFVADQSEFLSLLTGARSINRHANPPCGELWRDLVRVSPEYCNICRLRKYCDCGFNDVQIDIIQYLGYLEKNPTQIRSAFSRSLCHMITSGPMWSVSFFVLPLIVKVSSISDKTAADAASTLITLAVLFSQPLLFFLLVFFSGAYRHLAAVASCFYHNQNGSDWLIITINHYKTHWKRFRLEFWATDMLEFRLEMSAINQLSNFTSHYVMTFTEGNQLSLWAVQCISSCFPN